MEALAKQKRFIGQKEKCTIHKERMVEDRGNPIEKPGPTKMDGSCGGTLDEQWVRDEFYW